MLGRLFGIAAVGCYKATVNESETITGGQPARYRPVAPGSGFAAAPYLERS